MTTAHVIDLLDPCPVDGLVHHDLVPCIDVGPYDHLTPPPVPGRIRTVLTHSLVLVIRLLAWVTGFPLNDGLVPATGEDLVDLSR